MATLEDELKDLKEKNNELVQKVQYWKMTAAQRENEKLDLMKEINELRLKVIRLKSGSAAEARKLDAALQRASEDALSHLVQASSAITRTIDLAKTYMRERQDFDTASPRWSSISNSAEKVHRVPPMMMGGQSIQPVVSLSRTLNLSGQRSASRSPNASRNVTMRAVPMHILQDVYIPLTRIDMRDVTNNNESEQEPVVADDNGENIPFDTSMEEVAEESRNITDEDGYESSRRLEIVSEDLEPEDEVMTPPRARVENPLEGPSWLLESLAQRERPRPPPRRANLEPDSTTQGEEPGAPAGAPPADHAADTPETEAPARVFTPTVRRRKRASPPPEPEPAPTPEPDPSPNGMIQVESDRVLQVLVPKMRLDSSDASPPKRALRFDAPSPNGATDAGVIVLEQLARAKNNPPPREPSHRAHDSDDSVDGRDSRVDGRDSRVDGRDSRVDGRQSGDSDSGSGADRVSEGRTRRNRKPVTYKEKPLNSAAVAQVSPRSDEARTRRNMKPVSYKERPLNRKLRR